jgi:hypothetical protein
MLLIGCDFMLKNLSKLKHCYYRTAALNLSRQGGGRFDPDQGGGH